MAEIISLPPQPIWENTILVRDCKTTLKHLCCRDGHQLPEAGAPHPQTDVAASRLCKTTPRIRSGLAVIRAASWGCWGRGGGGHSAETRAPWSRATPLHRGYPDFPHFDLRLLFHPSRPSMPPPPTPPTPPRAGPPPGSSSPDCLSARPGRPTPSRFPPHYPTATAMVTRCSGERLAERRAGGASPSSSWRSRRLSPAHLHHPQQHLSLPPGAGCSFRLTSSFTHL